MNFALYSFVALIMQGNKFVILLSLQIGEYESVINVSGAVVFHVYVIS